MWIVSRSAKCRMCRKGGSSCTANPWHTSSQLSLKKNRFIRLTSHSVVRFPKPLISISQLISWKTLLSKVFKRAFVLPASFHLFFFNFGTVIFCSCNWTRCSSRPYRPIFIGLFSHLPTFGNFWFRRKLRFDVIC